MTKNRISSHLRCFPDYPGYLAGVLGESTLATQAEMNIYIYIYLPHTTLFYPEIGWNTYIIMSALSNVRSNPESGKTKTY